MLTTKVTITVSRDDPQAPEILRHALTNEYRIDYDTVNYYITYSANYFWTTEEVSDSWSAHLIKEGNE